MKTKRTSKQPVVPVRHMKFDFNPSKAPKYCWDNNSWGSAFILTFSAFIPAGERFVIDAVREFRDKTKDPQLRERVTGLIGQEAAHSRIHAEFNNMYDVKGLPINRLAEQSEKIYLKYLLPKVPKKTTLAIAAGIEHVTAILAEGAFGENIDSLDKMKGVTRDFLVWHLLEELEHKSVAFDLYQEIDGSYAHRIAAFIMIWALSVPFGIYALREILKTPGFSQGSRKNLRGQNYFINLTLRSSGKFLSYLRRDFHPDNLDTNQLLDEWLENLFGQGGELSEFVTKIITPESKREAVEKRMAS